MDPISQVDRLVMILRQRMLERAKSTSTKRKAVERGAAKATSLDSLKGLAALDAVDDQHLRRALVQNILADQFGETLVNDAKFQQVVERVTEALSEDENGVLLLNRLVSELRKTVR